MERIFREEVEEYYKKARKAHKEYAELLERLKHIKRTYHFSMFTQNPNRLPELMPVNMDRQLIVLNAAIKNGTKLYNELLDLQESNKKYPEFLS